MRVVHDWEFLETGNSVHPISVGMVREDGAELYYEFIDAPYTTIYKHEWLRANVIPVMSEGFNAAIVSGNSNAITKSRLTIRTKVYDFLKEAAQDSPLELWGWYSAYDHVCLGQLFGAMVYLPEFVPMYTNDMKQEADRLDVTIPNLRRDSEVDHNALVDARVEMRMLKWLDRHNELSPKNWKKDSIGIQFGNGNTQNLRFDRF